VSKHALTGWFRPSGSRFERCKSLILFAGSLACLDPVGRQRRDRESHRFDTERRLTA